MMSISQSVPVVIIYLVLRCAPTGEARCTNFGTRITEQMINYEADSASDMGAG